MAIKFREETLKFKPYVQGKTIESVKEKYKLKTIDKLASNENQYGLSSALLKKITKKIDEMNFYPDGSGKKVKEELAKKHKIKTENIVLGTGGEQLILLLSLLLLKKGDNIVVPAPTFDLYEMMATLMGAKTKKVPLNKDFSYNIKAMIEKVDKKTKILIVTTPNNPTGNIATKKEIETLLKKTPKDCLLLLDEAYFEYAKEYKEYDHTTKEKLVKRENVAIIRTFSKAFSLAGLRIGYLFTNKKIAEKLNSINLTFGVNTLAQEAALLSLKEKGREQFITKKNKEQLNYLYKELGKLNLNYIKTYANFLWIDIKKDSKKVFEELQKKGVIIRGGFHWGFKTFIRVSTGKEEQMKRFIKALKEVL